MQFTSWKLSLLRSLGITWKFADNVYRVDGTSVVLMFVSDDSSISGVRDKYNYIREEGYLPVVIVHTEECREGNLYGAVLEIFSENPVYCREEIALFDYLEGKGYMETVADRYRKRKGSA